MSMQKRWLNNREPDDKGEYTVTLETEEGVAVSTFKGKDKDELLEKVLESQINANLQLEKMYRRRTPDQGRTPLKLETKEFSPGDKMRLASEITDPDRVVDVISEIITARQGATAIGRRFEDMDEKEQDAYYFGEAEAFKA